MDFRHSITDPRGEIGCLHLKQLSQNQEHLVRIGGAFPPVLFWFCFKGFLYIAFHSLTKIIPTINFQTEAWTVYCRFQVWFSSLFFLTNELKRTDKTL